MNKGDIKEIWIEAEHWPKGKWNIKNANTDVIITLNDKRRFVASFFTYENIQSLVRKNEQTGECLSGTYLWASDMILICDCSRESIEDVIQDLIAQDEFEMTFQKVVED